MTVPGERSSGYWLYGVYGVLYVLLMGAVVGGSRHARSWSISAYGNPQAQAEWDEWRTQAAKLSTSGPIQRRVPKSDKPPAFILATHYFGICLTIVLVLTTVLFATAVYFVQGVLRSPGGSRKEKESRRPRNTENAEEA
jgi:hypothetical protein